MTSTVKTLCERYGISSQDVVRLHAFGMLGALFSNPETIAVVQDILDREFPQNAATGYQKAIYRLAIEFAHEQVRTENLLGQRVQHLWTERDQRFLEAAPEVRAAYQLEHPDSYHNRLEKEARYHKGELQPQPLPRLIDRIHRVPEKTAETYFQQLHAVTTAHQYSVLKLTYAEGLTVSQIAEQRGRAPHTIDAHLRKAFRAVNDHTKERLVPTILGKAPLGELLPAPVG